MLSNVICSLNIPRAMRCVDWRGNKTSLLYQKMQSVSFQLSEQTHHTSWAHRRRLGLLWPRLETQWRDSTGLQLDPASHARVSRCHLFEAVIFKVVDADCDVSPGRLFKALFVDCSEKLNPLQPPLGILRQPEPLRLNAATSGVTPDDRAHPGFKPDPG